jgi:transposase
MTGVISLAVYFEGMPRVAAEIQLAATDRLELERWVAAHGTPQQVSQRCRIILAAADGRQDKEIAEDLQINFKTAALWRQRFGQEGNDCLWEIAPGRGRKPSLPAGKVEQIIATTLQSRPAGATHWSCRTLAKEQGVSKAINSNRTGPRASNFPGIPGFWKS